MTQPIDRTAIVGAIALFVAALWGAWLARRWWRKNYGTKARDDESPRDW